MPSVAESPRLTCHTFGLPKVQFCHVGEAVQLSRQQSYLLVTTLPIPTDTATYCLMLHTQYQYRSNPNWNPLSAQCISCSVVTTTDLSPPPRWLATTEPTPPARCFTVFSAVFLGAVFWKLPLTFAASFDPCMKGNARQVQPALPHTSASPLNDRTATGPTRHYT